MSVLPLVSFVVIATAVLAFALLSLIAHDELRFQRRHRAANDGLIGPAVRPQTVRASAQPSPLPKAA